MQNKAIYFKSESCSVCISLLPKVQDLFKNKFPLLDLEICPVESNPEFATSMKVFTSPVLVVFFEGKEHFRFIRNFSILELEEKLIRPYTLLFQ